MKNNAQAFYRYAELSQKIQVRVVLNDHRLPGIYLET